MLSKDDVTGTLINPVYAISIDPDLMGHHEAIVSKQRWIEANQKLIKELGVEAWLRRLFDVLEGDFPASPEDPTSAIGYRSNS